MKRMMNAVNWKTRLLMLAILLLVPVQARAERPLGDIAALLHLADLGRLHDWRVEQSSGFNTLSDQGDAATAPPRDSQGRYVLFEAQGPGCVTRVWGSGLTGNLMIWIDDDRQPRLQAPWRQIAYSWWTYRTLVYEHKPEPPGVPPLLCPLADDSRGAQILMVPIGFTKWCKIAADQPPPGNQYGIDYVRISNAAVRPFDPQSLSPQRTPLQDVLALWRDPGDIPARDPAWKFRSGVATLQPGQSLTLLDEPGSGQVRLVAVECAVRNLRMARALVLRGTWDGGASPLLELPLGDLAGMAFASGNPNVPAGVEGLPPNTRRGDVFRLYSRLPMPFGKGGRLTLTNESPWPVCGFQWQIAWEPLPEGAPGYGRFAGFTRRLTPAAGADTIELLSLTGRGHLVGYNMAVWDTDQTNAPLRWFAEARLDGESAPRLQGAPFFDFNWGPRTYWHPGPVAGICGTTQHEYPGSPHGRGRVGFYRYMIEDAVRFEESCQVRLRRAAGASRFGHADLTWLFYLAPGSSRTWPALDRDALPWPETRSPAAIEAESLAAAAITGGTLSRVDDRWGTLQFSGGAMLVYAAENPGDVLTLPVPAPATGYYHLDLRRIGGPTFSTYHLQLHGRQLPESLAGGSASPGAAVGYDPHPCGVWHLVEGQNLFDFIFTPDPGHTGTLLGLDCLWLRPVSKRTNLTEAEYLPIVNTQSSTTAPEPMGHARASGWGTLAVQPAGPSAAVGLRLPVDKAFPAATLTVGYHVESKADFELHWDGRPLGSVAEEKQAVPFYRRLAAFALTDVTPGEHQVTVRLRAGTPPDQVGSESQPTTVRLRTAEPLWLDFLQLSRPGRCEAEALPVYTQAMTPWIEDAAPLPDDPTSTQNVALRCATVPKESPLFVGLPALRDGRHRVALWLWPDSGVCHFQFQVNGQPVKDASVSALQPGAATDLGVIPLVKGTNLLTIVSDAWFRFDAADVVPCD